MKRIFILSLFVFSSTLVFCQTQAEMNKAVHVQYQEADRELNSIYKQILQLYRTDTVFINNLKAAQRLWLQFREAEVKVKFPDREPGYYGSIAPLCWSQYRTELTRERISTLKQWVKGINEPDECRGSTHGNSSQ
jgi:uncharacterized protein YecT (DUF1311 family)